MELKLLYGGWTKETGPNQARSRIVIHLPAIVCVCTSTTNVVHFIESVICHATTVYKVRIVGSFESAADL